MSLVSILTNTPIYTIVEEDIQAVARHRLHRNLTPDELISASHLFAGGMDWWNVAESAVDIAVGIHK